MIKLITVGLSILLLTIISLTIISASRSEKFTASMYKKPVKTLSIQKVPPVCSGNGKLVEASDAMTGKIIKICSCNQGYGGANCSVTCDAGCGGRGKCVVSRGVAKCICDGIYSGETCMETVPFKKRLNNNRNNLVGIFDSHTHLMAHLAFGGKVIHGAPDVGTLMFKGTIYHDPEAGKVISSDNSKCPTYDKCGLTFAKGCSKCPPHNPPYVNDGCTCRIPLGSPSCNTKMKPASSISEALGTCKATHGDWDPSHNTCGNLIRKIVIGVFEDANEANKPHGVDQTSGYPTFADWPKSNDILHQGMWIDWIRRAYDGGLRLLVALAFNNYSLAKGIQGDAPLDDKSSGNLQIDELKKFVARHIDWMEIAYSSEDIRRIVGEMDKLCVIIGVEYDDIGNFMMDKKVPNVAQMENEIQQLYDSGVRYIFPLHLTDNLLGGTAIYEKFFSVPNRYHYGRWWDVRCATPESGVTLNMIEKDFGNNIKEKLISQVMSVLLDGKGLGDTQNFPECKDISTGVCPRDKNGNIPQSCVVGHVNARGLQQLGIAAIRKMMSLKMIIDIDHTSLQTFNDIFATFNYPFVSGHNVMLSSDSSSEMSHTMSQYKEIANFGGVAGVGINVPEKFIESANEIASTGIKIGLGSDINGFVKMPSKPSSNKVIYDNSFPRCQTGQKTWDYNTDGFAHYGLFPDFLRAINAEEGGKQTLKNLFQGVEGFAKMWEKCEGKQPQMMARMKSNIFKTETPLMMADYRFRR